MANFYATRTQFITSNIAEHHLLRFGSRASRDRYLEVVGGQMISARDAEKLCVADLWRGYRNVEADCVFQAARYVP